MAQVYYPPNYGNDAEERRLKKLQLMIQLGHNISQAYLGGQAEDRMGALADLKIGQDTENKDLLRQVVGRRGGEINPNDILASDAERQGIQEPSAFESFKRFLLGDRTPVEETTNIPQSNPNQTFTATPWESINSTSKQDALRTRLLSAEAKRQGVPITSLIKPDGQSRLISDPKYAPQAPVEDSTINYGSPLLSNDHVQNQFKFLARSVRQGGIVTPVQKAEAIKQTFTGKAGWGDSAPEQYQNNLDQLKADLKSGADPKFAFAEYYERNRGYDNIYKRERSGHDDAWLSLGGGGRGPKVYDYGIFDTSGKQIMTVSAGSNEAAIARARKLNKALHPNMQLLAVPSGKEGAPSQITQEQIARVEEEKRKKAASTLNDVFYWPNAKPTEKAAAKAELERQGYAYDPNSEKAYNPTEVLADPKNAISTDGRVYTIDKVPVNTVVTRQIGGQVVRAKRRPDGTYVVVQ